MHSKQFDDLQNNYRNAKKTLNLSLQKLLSAGLLGKGSARKMVPTRWSITAVDDTLSKNMLDKIRYYTEEDKILLFSGNFVGNYIEILVLPGRFSFFHSYFLSLNFF